MSQHFSVHQEIDAEDHLNKMKVDQNISTGSFSDTTSRPRNLAESIVHP